jgi:ABC-2 type transport system permease protein
MRIFNMNIFLRELRANLKSLIIWCVVLALLVMIAAAKFSAFAGNPDMLKMLDSMPKALLDAFNMRAFNLTTLNGLFGLMFIYFALMGAMAAALWGSDIISKEERDKTVEFSLVLPVSRNRLITAKALAALVNCVAFVLVTWAISILAAQSYDPNQEFYTFLALEMLAMMLIGLIFLAIGLFLGCSLKRYKRASAIAIAIILVTYFASVVSGMQENLDFLKYLSPFKYFDAGELYRNMRLDNTYLIISFLLILICLAGAYWTYNKRDLYI